jgi:hypothetical protein
MKDTITLVLTFQSDPKHHDFQLMIVNPDFHIVDLLNAEKEPYLGQLKKKK